MSLLALLSPFSARWARIVTVAISCRGLESGRATADAGTWNGMLWYGWLECWLLGCGWIYCRFRDSCGWHGNTAPDMPPLFGMSRSAHCGAFLLVGTLINWQLGRSLRTGCPYSPQRTKPAFGGAFLYRLVHFLKLPLGVRGHKYPYCKQRRGDHDLFFCLAGALLLRTCRNWGCQSTPHVGAFGPLHPSTIKAWDKGAQEARKQTRVSNRKQRQAGASSKQFISANWCSRKASHLLWFNYPNPTTMFSFVGDNWACCGDLWRWLPGYGLL